MGGSTDIVGPAGIKFLASVRKARIPPGQIALWYIGGAGYVVRTAGTTLLIDPFLGPSNPPEWVRTIPPAFAPDAIGALGPLDALIMTHEHSDHADPLALQAVAAHTAIPVYGPGSCMGRAAEAGVPEARRHAVAWDEAFTVGDLRVTVVPALDPMANGCNGYILQTANTTLLHCGDSLYFDGFAEMGKRWAIDAVCVSVGLNPPGQTFYMDEADAARAARDSRTRTLIPQHFDLWRGFTLDPRRVRTVTAWYAPEAKVVPARFRRRITVGGGRGSEVGSRGVR